MATDLLAAIANVPWYGGHVLVEDGWYPIYQPLNLWKPGGYGVSIGGHSSSGVIIEQMTPDTPILKYESPVSTRAGLDLHDMTLVSRVPGVEAVRNVNGGRSKYRDLVFRGTRYTIHADGGLGHSIRNCLVETYDNQPCGTMFLHCTSGVANGVDYCQHINIDNYMTLYQAGSPLVILSRVTNLVMSHFSAYAPGPSIDCIQLYDDSQGIQFSDHTVVGGHDGLVIVRSNGNKPLVVEADSFNADQMSGVGIRAVAGTDVTIMGGCVTSSFQGFEVAGYPDVERTIILGSRAMQNAHNGIVLDPNAAYFTIMGTVESGNTAGAGIVLSGGSSGHYTMAYNDTSQNNASGLVDAANGAQVVSPNGPTHRITSPNI